MYLDSPLLHMISGSCNRTGKEIEDLCVGELQQEFQKIATKYFGGGIQKAKNTKLKVFDILIEARKLSNNGLITIDGFVKSWDFLGDGVFDKDYVTPNRKQIINAQEITIFPGTLMNGKGYDPILSRDKELEDMITILTRKKKNSVLLIGKAGTGKTSLVQELCNRITNNYYNKLEEYQIIQVDSSTMKMMPMIPQTAHKLEQIIDMAIRKRVILFFDEFHSICNEASQRQFISLIDKFKPEMAEGNLQIIGATTPEEYKRDIEGDNALLRRMQTVKVEELSTEATIEALELLSPLYERYHQCSINNADECFKIITDLTKRYISNKAEPDRSLDIIDETLSSKTNNQRLDISTQHREIDILTALYNKDIEKATSLIDVALGNHKPQIGKTVVNIEDFKITIARKANIPVSLLDRSDLDRVKLLDTTLRNKIIGQDKAVEAFVDTITRMKCGLADPNKPVSIMLAGPTGTGKTYLAKVASEILFDGKKDSFIRLDMSEFTSGFTTSSLIGSPPGYVDSGKGGRLTENVYNNPYCILLLDEIEKAHDNVINILLSILDEGHLTDSMGKNVNFKNTIILMSTNEGMELVKQSNNTLGFFGTKGTEVKMNEKDMKVGLKTRFRPEFLNRLDKICIFDYLDKEDIKKIIDLEIEYALKRIEIPITIKETTKNKVIDEYYEKEYGARSIKRGVETLIINEIAKKLLDTPNIKKITI